MSYCLAVVDVGGMFQVCKVLLDLLEYKEVQDLPANLDNQDNRVR